MQEKKRIGIECKNVIYCPKPENLDFDLHLVKVNVHYDDGTYEPKLIKKTNHQRNFWIAKRREQNYQEKKERFPIDGLDEYKTTEHELQESIKRALDMGWYNGNPNKFMNSPYLFGTDISSSAVLKEEIRRANRHVKETYNSVAVYDIETNVLTGPDGKTDQRVICSSLTFKDKICTTVLKSFLGDIRDPLQKLHAALERYLGRFVKARKIKEWDLHIFDDERDVIAFPFQRAHEWRPDFVTIWNINYDIPHILKRMELLGMNPEDVFCDPAIDKEFRYFRYTEGPARKTSNAGVTINFIPAERWHTAEFPASFYLIDSMCVYQKLRVHKGKLASYGLDFILGVEFQKEKNAEQLRIEQPDKILAEEIRKLKFPEADHIPGGTIEWHKFMQERYPVEYCVYNVFDCITVELLDEKILDLAVAFTKNVEFSDFKSFPSQPKKLADEMHWFSLDTGYVYGTGGGLETDMDKYLIGLNDWICTLPAHLVKDNGLKVIKGSPNLRTNIRGGVADADVTASYPNSNAVFNTSRETTEKELIDIEGVSEKDRRMQGIILCGGWTNSVEITTELFGLPNLFSLDKMFKENR